jgi:hypothetical protein
VIACDHGFPAAPVRQHRQRLRPQRFRAKARQRNNLRRDGKWANDDQRDATPTGPEMLAHVDEAKRASLRKM